MKSLMRVVLDTNVVMSAIFFGGVPFEVLSAWHTVLAISICWPVTDGMASKC